MSRDGLVVRSLVSSAILASISLVSSERVRAMPSALDRSLDTFASISWREVSADCASKGTLASGMGVGAGVGFAGEPEACWPGAVPPLKAKARIIRRTTRTKGCIRYGKKGSERRLTFCDGSLTQTGVLISLIRDFS